MLFDLPSNTAVITSLPTIVDNYNVLHFDEYPILFTGTNEFGNNVVGSLMCEDEDEDVFRYLYLLVKPSDFILFINQKLSYLEIIEKQKTAFLIDKNFEDEILRTYNINTIQIPKEYLPLPNVFIPYKETYFGTNILVSLKGKLADAHEAIAERISIISKGLNQIFTTLSDVVKSNSITPEIRQLAYSPTSFGLNYKIVFKTNGELFFDETGANEFMAKSLDYSINHLAFEVEKIKNGDTDDTYFKTMIEEPLMRMSVGALTKPLKEKAIKNLLKIPFDMEKITDQLGLGFNYIEFNSIGSEEKQSSIGIINNNTSAGFEIAKDLIESTNAKIKIDDDFENYRIHIYHLNIISRKGNAHIANIDKEGKDILDSPKIIILGDKPLDGSEFISSMDTGSYIEIRAKAKKVNDRYKVLTIDF